MDIVWHLLDNLLGYICGHQHFMDNHLGNVNRYGTADWAVADRGDLEYDMGLDDCQFLGDFLWVVRHRVSPLWV